MKLVEAEIVARFQALQGRYNELGKFIIAHLIRKVDTEALKKVQEIMDRPGKDMEPILETGEGEDIRHGKEN